MVALAESWRNRQQSSRQQSSLTSVLSAQVEYQKQQIKGCVVIDTPARPIEPLAKLDE